MTSGLNDVTVGGEVSYDAAKSAITKVRFASDIQLVLWPLVPFVWALVPWQGAVVWRGELATNP